MTPIKTDSSSTSIANVWEIFLIFLRLGLTSFGGPVAHIGYFRDEFVSRRHWLSDRSYTDLIALCQFLPGPASSQVGLALGLSRAGYAGALAAWLGFTLPSALALVLFALSISTWGDTISQGLLQGLKIAAVAVVAQAVWGMARHLCASTLRITLMAIACCVVLLWPTALGQVSVIVAAGIAGLFLFEAKTESIHEPLTISIHRRTGILFLTICIAVLIGLPVLVKIWPNQALLLFDVFYRAGALVFGGGHVILPLLQAEVVPNGWIQNDTFLAGYGAAQAIPGPLFTFAAFLGASMTTAPNGWTGAILSLIAIFIPSFLIVAGALPFWEQLRSNRRIQTALIGVNAAVVGLLLAALYDPVWTSAIHSPADFALALMALVALMFWRLPAWLVVLASGFSGWLFSLII